MISLEMRSAESELKKCPFCGSDAEFCEGKYGDGKPWFFIACEQCEATQPAVSQCDLSKYDKTHNIAKMSAAWNGRITDK